MHAHWLSSIFIYYNMLITCSCTDSSSPRPHGGPLGRQVRALQAHLHNQGRLLREIRRGEASLGWRHHGAESYCADGEEEEGARERYQDLDSLCAL